MAVTLPKYAVLQSAYNLKYLQFVHHGYLQFLGDDVVSPYTKFEVQVSESDKTLVHLRTCYNNKYFVPSTRTDNLVLVGANEPEEDRTKPKCTLFQPMYAGDDSKAVRFKHVSSGKYVAFLSDPGKDIDACLYLVEEELPNQILYDLLVTDWSSFVLFPQNIAVKGTADSAEGKYLSALPHDGVRYFQFVADDLADPTVGQKVSTTGAGNIRIESTHYEKLWTRTYSSYIIADVTPDKDDVDNQNVLFSPARIPDRENVFALRNLGNNDYCKSIDMGGDEVAVLSAADGTITAESCFEVVDRGTSWGVTIVFSDYVIRDYRMMSPTKVVLGETEVTNDSDSDVDMTVTISYEAHYFTYIYRSTANGSLTVGVTPVTLTAIAPNEVNGKIILTGPTVRDTVWHIIWGDEVKDSDGTTNTTTYTVTVPAKTKATIQAVGEKRSWDIPYSYNQDITLVDGRVSSLKMHDGVYTGSENTFESFDVKFASLK